MNVERRLIVDPALVLRRHDVGRFLMRRRQRGRYTFAHPDSVFGYLVYFTLKTVALLTEQGGKQHGLFAGSLLFFLSFD